MLKVENISKSFGKLKVLKNISLEVNKGDRVVIIGPSGSGKSTFLRCINYLAKPDSGKIYLDNHELNDNNIFLYRQKIGMVFQNFNLFNNLNLKIFLFFIFCFPLLLFSISGFNGESIVYVIKYIFNFLIKQKLYLFKKSP